MLGHLEHHSTLSLSMATSTALPQQVAGLECLPQRDLPLSLSAVSHPFDCWSVEQAEHVLFALCSGAAQIPASPAFFFPKKSKKKNECQKLEDCWLCSFSNKSKFWQCKTTHSNPLNYQREGQMAKQEAWVGDRNILFSGTQKLWSRDCCSFYDSLQTPHNSFDSHKANIPWHQPIQQKWRELELLTPERLCSSWAVCVRQLSHRFPHTTACILRWGMSRSGGSSARSQFSKHCFGWKKTNKEMENKK